MKIHTYIDIKGRNSGFTLIELLVVIAIIGILASIVLSSLNTARNKGTDAAIIADLGTIRTQAELYADASGSYADLSSYPADNACTLSDTVFTDATVAQTITAIEAMSDSPVICSLGGSETGGSASGWAASTTTKSGDIWCVDSEGASGAGKAAANGICG